MTAIRWAAVAVLTLMSLMNLGPGDNSTGLTVLGAVLGVLGLGAVFGMVRRYRWGLPAAAAVAGANLITAVLGLAVGWDGAVIMLVVSLIGLALSLLAGPVAGRMRLASR